MRDAEVEVAFPSMSVLCAQVTATKRKLITATEGSQLQVNPVLGTVPTPRGLPAGTDIPHALCLFILSLFP